MKSHRTALIVGAGIGGLAAGIALRQRGWHVRIFERATSPRELGFALNLAPNAIAALRELGLADPVIAEADATGEIEVRSAAGRLLRKFNVAAALERAPSVMALRQVLHGTLLSAIEPDVLQLSSEAVAYAATPTGIVLSLKDGRSASGDVLVGADGIGSIIRRLLHPHEPPLRRSGYYGVRAVAHNIGHELGNLSAVVYFGHGLEAAMIRAGKNSIYWYVSLLTEDVPFGARVANVLAERCAAQLDDQFRAVSRATGPEDIRLDELYDRDPIRNWGSGPVTLLGDAAHPMLPHTGQGAAQALEDAVALKLALASGDDMSALLRRYERVRSSRTRAIVKRGRRIARITTTKSRLIGWLRNVGLRIAPMNAVLVAFLLGDMNDPHRELR